MLLQFPVIIILYPCLRFWSSFLRATWAHQLAWLLPFSPSQITSTPSCPRLQSPHLKESNCSWTSVPCVKKVCGFIYFVSTGLNADVN